MEVKQVNRFFDIAPRVVLAGAKTTIKITPLQQVHARDEYQVAYWPLDGYGSAATWEASPDEPVEVIDGVIHYTRTFEGEQEHVLVLKWADNGGAERSAELHIYSVAEDLFARRPYKGDIHLHSCRSDGSEDPAYVAGACRRIGLDFMALTDHGAYAPSLEVIDAYKDVDADLRMYPGEEVHLPETPPHIINFGGSRSVNMTSQEAHDAFEKDVAKLVEQIGPVPEGVNAVHYAGCVWAFDKIRQAGGLGVFCHPYWVAGGRYHPGMPLTDHIFDTQPFDAYEVIGGYDADCDSNTLQTAHYHSQLAKGRKVPVVGVTDAHSTAKHRYFDTYYTIAFAPSADLADLISSIKDLYSVAMESLPNDRPRPVGPLRLTKYALFCEREIFPQHDELCREEGRLMLAYIGGEPGAAAALARLSGRTAALYDKYWGGK